MDNNVCIPLNIILVTFLSNADWTPNFLGSNYFIPTTSGISYVAIVLTVGLFWESLPRLQIKIYVTPLSSPWQSSVPYKLPWWDREMVL